VRRVNEQFRWDRTSRVGAPVPLHLGFPQREERSERRREARMECHPRQLGFRPALPPDQETIGHQVDVRDPEPDPLDAPEAPGEAEDGNESQARVRPGHPDNRLNGLLRQPPYPGRGAYRGNTYLLEHPIATELREVREDAEEPWLSPVALAKPGAILDRPAAGIRGATFGAQIPERAIGRSSVLAHRRRHATLGDLGVQPAIHPLRRGRHGSAKRSAGSIVVAPVGRWGRADPSVSGSARLGDQEEVPVDTDLLEAPGGFLVCRGERGEAPLYSRSIALIPAGPTCSST
jgi:hypothetical protein